MQRHPFVDDSIDFGGCVPISRIRRRMSRLLPENDLAGSRATGSGGPL